MASQSPLSATAVKLLSVQKCLYGQRYSATRGSNVDSSLQALKWSPDAVLVLECARKVTYIWTHGELMVKCGLNKILTDEADP